MKRLHVAALWATGLALCLSACKGKDKEEPGLYGDLSSARASVAPQPVTFTVDAATGGVFQGRRYRYAFQPNAFRTPAGATVTGAVTVEALDVFSPSEMIFSRIMPVSNGDGLVSGGEVRILASQNGQQLRMAPGMPVDVRMPQDGNNTAGMEFFRGTATPDSAISLVNWNKRDQGSTGNGAIVVAGDTVHLFSDSLGYMNADRFLANPNYQSFTITVTGVSGLTSAQVSGSTIYDQYNGMWGCSSFSSNVFNENHVPNIPIHFVVYAVVNGHFYSGISGFTPATGSNYTVSLSETTPAAFKTQIDAL